MTRRIFPIAMVVFSNILGASVIIPLLALYAEGQFQATALQATLLSTSYFAAQFVAAPWLGRLSDIHGRRPILLASQVGTIFSFVLFIFAGPMGQWIDATGVQLPVTGGMVMLYLARVIDGITGGNITIAQAYVSDISTEENRAQSLGLLAASFSLGFIIGPAFGGFLAEFGLVAPFIGAAIIITGTLFLTIFTLPESLLPEERAAPDAERQSRLADLTEFFQYVPVRLILIIGFGSSLTFAALQSTFALYADHVLFPDRTGAEVVRSVGLMFSVFGAVGVLTQGVLLKPLVQRFREQALIVAGQVFTTITMGTVALVTNPTLITIGILPFSFGRGITEPSMQSLLTRFTNAQNRGRVLGLYQSAVSMGLIIGPIWAGLVFDFVSPQATYLVAAGLATIVFGISLLLARVHIPAAGTAATD